MKDKILAEVRKHWIPNFGLLRQKESLAVLPELLNELLEIEKEKFKKLVNKDNESLTFDDFIEPSDLDYLWRLLNHIDNCYEWQEMRDIISNFRPQLEDFINEESYSKPYYEKLLFMRKKEDLNSDQKRILDLWIRNYKQRGIDLEEDKQEELKAINKEYSMVSEKFQHNVVDDRAQFSYYLEDDSIIPWIPLSTKNRAKKLAWEKPWYLFDADPTALWDLL